MTEYFKLMKIFQIIQVGSSQLQQPHCRAWLSPEKRVSERAKHFKIFKKL